jgi:hypothetical protein
MNQKFSIIQILNFVPQALTSDRQLPHDVLEKTKYSKAPLGFLKMVNERFGPFPCRDEFIVRYIENKGGLDGYYAGDIALYDPEKIRSKFRPSRKVRAYAFTIGHHPKYDEQARALLKSLRQNFPKAKAYISLHSRPNHFSSDLAQYAVNQLGYEVIFTYGEIENLLLYNNIDLHVGYRLHGHIYFLRNRKPSVLIAEDIRAYGFSESKDTRHGSFHGMDETGAVKEGLHEDIKIFLNEEIRISPILRNDYRPSRFVIALPTAPMCVLKMERLLLSMFISKMGCSLPR